VAQGGNEVGARWASALTLANFYSLLSMLIKDPYLSPDAHLIRNHRPLVNFTCTYNRQRSITLIVIDRTNASHFRNW
jgi:hypothetical protein